jgi:hypothetical protein
MKGFNQFMMNIQLKIKDLLDKLYEDVQNYRII